MPPILRAIRPFTLTVFCLPFFFCPNFARLFAAQETAAPNPSTETDALKKNAISYRQAIESALLARPVLVLALEGQEESLPELKGATVEQVAMQFKKTWRDCGWVLAIGPQTITQLETNLGEPDPFADMPPQKACTLLMSLLNDAQRSKMLSETGIGLSDMTDTDQKQLFQALLPKGEVGYIKYGTSGTHSIENVVEKFADAKLRIGQAVQILEPISGNSYHNLSLDKLYQMTFDSAYHNLDTVNGARIRSEVPNLPKRGHLNLSAEQFRTEIALDGLKTVGEMIERIGKQSGVELYADAHYEKRKLILRTGRKSAPMSDLLYALAHCVGGTYRKVGPAYVLTDDLLGAGTRRQIICDFEELADAMRYSPVTKAKRDLQGNPAIQKTPPPFFNALLKPTPEQEKQSKSNRASGHEGMGDMLLSYDQLNTDQKALVDEYHQAHKSELDHAKYISLDKEFVVQFLIPGLDSPLRTNFEAGIRDIFEKDNDYHEPDEAELKKKLLTGDGPKLWSEKSKGFSQRGLIARPHSKDEVDRALRRVQEFRLNQLWLVIFENGKALLPGTPFPLLPALKDQPDLLAYAIEAAKKMNVTVCPVVEMFAWGSDTSPEMRDHNLRGEDTEQYTVRHQHILTLKADTPKNLPPPPKRTVWVNPLNMEVQQKLSGLLKKIAAYPGIGTIVWNSDIPWGYADDRLYWWSFPGSLLGYNEEMRLAFLRSKHLDPIDTKSSNSYSDSFENRANEDLPQYDNGEEQNDWIAWHDFCDLEIQNVFRQLYANMIIGLMEKNRPSVLLMQGQRTQSQLWYNQWLLPTDPLPKFVNRFSDVTGEGISATGNAKSETPPKKPASFLRLVLPTHYGPVTLDRKDWPAVLGFQLKPFVIGGGRKWDGFVLEEDDVPFNP